MYNRVFVEQKLVILKAMVVAQLVKLSLLTSDVCCSNPVNSKNYTPKPTVSCIVKTQLVNKSPRMADFLLKFKTF